MNHQTMNNPSTDETIVPAVATTIEAEQPSTLNPVRPCHPGGLQPLNPDMEVHHHAHDTAAPHHKKNGKIIILLIGGNKSSQQKDIEKAKEIWDKLKM